MRKRTRVAAAAAVTAAVAAGSIGAAVASTTGAKPGAHPKSVTVSAKTVNASAKRRVKDDLASRLGVSPARLDQALRAVKISMSKQSAKPTVGQFDATLARILGIPQARVRREFPVPADAPRGSRAVISKTAVSKTPMSKAAMRAEFDAFTSAVARALHVSTAQVKRALRPVFAAGRADPTSRVFAAAARSLGVSTSQLSAALRHAKQSLRGGK